MKKIFAFCDIEKDYVDRFMNYVNNRCSLPFSVCMFTDTKALTAFSKRNDIELLVVGEGAASEEIMELKTGETILLRGGQSEEKSGASGREVPCVYKYQSAACIVRDVMDCYSAERIAEAPEVIRKRSGRRIGVISPGDPNQKTAFAVTLGQILAEEHSTVYFNLEPFSGIADIAGEREKTLSDLLYFFRQGKKGLIYQLGGMTERLHEMDFVPPAAEPDDLMVMSGREWRDFFETIMKTGPYENIVMDIGGGISGLAELADFCDDIWVPVSGDTMGSAGGRVFISWLKKSGIEEERIHIFETGGEQICGDGRAFFEAQFRGAMGSKIRTLEWENRRT